MRFNHANPIALNQYNGFVPPTTSSAMFVRNAAGQVVVIGSPEQNSPEAYQADMSEFQSRLKNHNWYYHLSANQDVYTNGYLNEKAMMEMIHRRGGVFETLWETERRRHLDNV